MPEAAPLFVLHVLGFAGFLWLGLYALTRGDGKDIAAVTGIAALREREAALGGALPAANPSRERLRPHAGVS